MSKLTTKSEIKTRLAFIAAELADLKSDCDELTQTFNYYGSTLPVNYFINGSCDGAINQLTALESLVAAIPDEVLPAGE